MGLKGQVASYGASDLLARSVGLVSSPILTRLLTPVQYGAAPTVLASWGPFATSQFAGMDYVLPYVLARGDHAATRRLIAACTTIALVAGAVIWAIFFIVSISTGWLAELASASQLETAVLVASFLPLGWTTWTMLILRFTYRAKEFAWLSFGSRILPTTLVIATLAFFPQEQRLLVAWTITLISGLLAASYAITKLRGAIPGGRILRFPGWRRSRRLLKMGLALVPAGIVYSLFSIADRLVVAGALGTEAVAVLAVGLALGSGGPMLSSWLGLALDPHLTRWSVGGLSELERSSLQRILSTGTRLLCVSALLAAATLPYITSVLYPTEYSTASDVASVMFFAGVVTAMSRIAVGTTFRRMQIRYHMPIYVAALALNVSLSLAFIDALGIVAVALSTLVSEVVILASWIMLDRVLLRELKMSWGRPMLIATLTGCLVVLLLQLPETLVATPLFAVALGFPLVALLAFLVSADFRVPLMTALRKWRKSSKRDADF